MNKFGLLSASTIFLELCKTDGKELTKISFIRKMPKGYWGVFSHKGKLLGKYKTKQEAKKRLQQIEFFKHKKASKEEEITYSACLREIKDKYPKEILQEFKKIFKDTFDKELISGNNDPEEQALLEALKLVQSLDYKIEKAASAIEMGDPGYAGKYISEIIKFLMRRISPINRNRAIRGLRKKIFMLNEYELSDKKMPASSSLGQAISLTKNLLMMHQPHYIREVLNSIVRNLQ